MKEDKWELVKKAINIHVSENGDEGYITVRDLLKFINDVDTLIG